MKYQAITFCAMVLFSFTLPVNSQVLPVDKVQALKDTLAEMALRTDNELFKNHCNWFIEVIDAQEQLSTLDSAKLSNTYDSFCIVRETGNRREFSSCLTREYPLLIAWTSPTDGRLSFGALRLPANWDPEISYPLYIHLHGLASDTDRPIDFLCRYFLKAPNTSSAYEDGYLIFPWGRGNLWYQGISETDIWESKAAVEQLFKVDVQRQYILGHSMGGYGAWYIAARSPEVWAALGVEAGALGYGNAATLSEATIQQLKDLPACFVVGVQDGLFDVNLNAYNLLNAAGNENTNFISFNGGHEHLDMNELLLYYWLQDFVNEDYTKLKEEQSVSMEAPTCFPNPFVESIKITFVLKRSQHMQLSICSLQGEHIEIIAEGEYPEGLNTISYAPANLPPAIFLCRLESGDGQILYRKMIKIQ
jgi:pimeloyl-ACP methyl ester carboxylesterase